MFPSFFITFRETLEVVIVLGIVLALLKETGIDFLRKYVFYGLIAGISVSLALALGIEIVLGSFSGFMEQVFEGILMFVTGVFLTWMVLWVHKQEGNIRSIKKEVIVTYGKSQKIGIFLISFTAVLREGVETVLYLKASSIMGLTGQLTGAFLGILSALLIGISFGRLILKSSNLPKFFKATTVFLLLFAAGMFGYAVHEFQEANILPVFPFDPIINISHILDHKSILGSFLRVLFGYTSKPTLLELMVYVGYLSSVWLFLRSKVKRALGKK